MSAADALTLFFRLRQLAKTEYISAPMDKPQRSRTEYQDLDTMNEAPEPLDADQEQWLGDELEQAYQRALQANEAVESEFGLRESDVSGKDTDDIQNVELSNDESAVPRQRISSDKTSPQRVTNAGTETVSNDLTVGLERLDGDRANDDIDASKLEGRDSNQRDGNSEQGTIGSDDSITRPIVTAKQVVEAALFVGGTALTTKKLGSLLSRNDARDIVERSIEELNSQYASEARPYEIVFGEGGYRLTLRPEYERLRNRVYGLGPKDIRLSQEALQVLAMVAYRQPITRQEIEEVSDLKAGNVLGQLLRRELIMIRRGENEPRRKDVSYRTTPRFLSLFGLGNIEELPRIDDLDFK